MIADSLPDKWGHSLYKDLEAVAQRNDIRDYKFLIDRVCSAVFKFKDYARELNIGQALIESIESDFIRV
jgi:hypothetical protein